MIITRILATVYTILLLQGCVGGRELPFVKPIHIDPSYVKYSIDNITVLPVVDGRKDRSVIYDFNKAIRAQIGATLIIDRGYSINHSDKGNSNNFTEDELEELTSHQIKTIGPKDARWILLFVVNDIQSIRLQGIGSFGTKVSAEITAYLFDQEQGKLIWKNKGLGRDGQGGLFGLVDPEKIYIDRSIGDSVRDLLSGLPKKGVLDLKFKE